MNTKLTESPASRLLTLFAAVAAFALSTNLGAQTQPSKAEVRGIRGSAVYSVAGSPAAPLKVGDVLYSGTTIKTASKSTVDLFLGRSAGTVRVTENSTLALDKLMLTDTGADTVVEVQMNLPEGTILGNVNKLSAASKYEIKVPNGVAGIRGTFFRLSSTGYAYVDNGTMVFVYVGPDGVPKPFTLTGPPAVFFSPLNGTVQQAPPDMVKEILKEAGPPFDRTGPPGPPFQPPGPPPWVSPGIGKKPVR